MRIETRRGKNPVEMVVLQTAVRWESNCFRAANGNRVFYVNRYNEKMQALADELKCVTAARNIRLVMAKFWAETREQFKQCDDILKVMKTLQMECDGFAKSFQAVFRRIKVLPKNKDIPCEAVKLKELVFQFRAELDPSVEVLKQRLRMETLQEIVDLHCRSTLTLRGRFK